MRPLFLSIGQPSAERAADEDIPADGKESEVRVRRAEPIGRDVYKRQAVGSAICGGWLRYNAPRINAYKNLSLIHIWNAFIGSRSETGKKRFV